MRANRTTTKLSAADIQQQLEHLAADVHHAADVHKTRRDQYTDKGFRDTWQDRTVNQKLRAAQLAQLPSAYAQQAAQARDKARAALMPTAGDPTTQMAAEAAWGRISSRPAYRNAEPGARWELIRTEVENMPPSPARTLMLSEAEARGDIDGSTVEALLTSTSAEYKEVCDAATHAHTAAQILDRRAQGIMNTIDTIDAAAPGALSTVDVTAVPGADIVRDTGIGTDVFDGPHSVLS